MRRGRGEVSVDTVGEKEREWWVISQGRVVDHHGDGADFCRPVPSTYRDACRVQSILPSCVCGPTLTIFNKCYVPRYNTKGYVEFMCR